MPIHLTINDCKTHRKEPKLEFYGRVILWCEDCDLTPECDVLYVSDTDLREAVKTWNRRNKRRTRKPNAKQTFWQRLLGHLLNWRKR